MSSAPKLIALALIAACFAGCQRAETSSRQQLSAAPIIEDEAMALRQWEPVVARYPSGVSISYPTLYPYVARRDVPMIESAVMNPTVFFAQTLMLPVTFFAAPAWEPEANRGVYTEPTYTAVPAVAPDVLNWYPNRIWDLPTMGE